MVTKKLLLVWEFKITLLVTHESKKKQLVMITFLKLSDDENIP